MNVPPTSVPSSLLPSCLTNAAGALVLACAIVSVTNSRLAAQTLPPLPGFQPSDVSPTINTEVSTMITTGCGYDAWSGSVHRVVTDLVVPSAASSQGLKVVRTYSSSNGIGWSMSWQWQIHFRPWSSDGSYLVNFPDGRAERFLPPRPSQTGETAYRGAAGTNERLYSSDLNQNVGTADLWLEDGSVVHFDRITEYSDATQQLTDYFTPRSFTDPYGKVTTLSNVQYGPEYR